MSQFAAWRRVCPAATLSTFLFYGTVAVALVSKPRRQGLLARLAAPPPSTHAYTGALDAYRGLAALAVAFGYGVSFCNPIFWASMLCAPYLIWNGGHQAVPVFVMLSGLLIFFPGLLLWCALSYIVIERPFLMMRPVRLAAVAPPAGERPAAVADRQAA